MEPVSPCSGQLFLIYDGQDAAGGSHLLQRAIYLLWGYQRAVPVSAIKSKQVLIGVPGCRRGVAGGCCVCGALVAVIRTGGTKLLSCVLLSAVLCTLCLHSSSISRQAREAAYSIEYVCGHSHQAGV
jgi:hypothetical protein